MIDYSLSKMFQHMRIIFIVQDTSTRDKHFASLGFILIENRQIHHKNHGTLIKSYLNSGKRGNL